MSKSFHDKERRVSKKYHQEMIDAVNNGNPSMAEKCQDYLSNKKIKRYGNLRKQKALQKVKIRRKERKNNNKITGSHDQ